MSVPTKVYIGNLPEDGDKEELHKELEEKLGSFGKIVEFDIVFNYGFVHYEQEPDAKDAVQSLNGSFFRGRKIKVELSRSKVRHKPGMGSDKGCFRCGGEGHWSKSCPNNPRGRGDDNGNGGGRSQRGSSFGRRDTGNGSDRYGGRDRYGDRDYDRYGDRGRYPGRDAFGDRDRDRDPYADLYRDRFSSSLLDRYRPYPSLLDRRRLAAAAAAMPSMRDPYERPPPDYYASRLLSSALSDPLAELYLERLYGRLPMPRSAGRDAPPSSQNPRPQSYPH